MTEKTTKDYARIAADVMDVIRASCQNSTEEAIVLALANRASSTWHASEFTRQTLGLPLHDSKTCEECKTGKH